MGKYFLNVIDKTLVLYNLDLNDIPSNAIQIEEDLVEYFRSRICSYNYNGKAIEERAIVKKEEIDKYLDIKINIEMPKKKRSVTYEQYQDEISKLQDAISKLSKLIEGVNEGGVKDR